jgi:hypothetical protein
MSRWIKVDNKLPPPDVDVWVYDPVSDVVDIAQHNGLYWEQGGFWAYREDEITHWMPLDRPAVPKQGE